MKILHTFVVRLFAAMLVMFVSLSAIMTAQASAPGAVNSLPVSYNWMVEGDQGDAVLGTSAASAGDVNGDGYADIIVTACGYDSGYPNYYYDEGKAYLYYGSSTGLSSVPDWTAESAISEGALCRATTAGDVNGDGFSDVIAGMTNYTNGEYREGGVFIWYGSASGLGENGTPSNADWKAESNQANSQMGGGAASAGDVNGDGYSDVIAAAHHYSNGEFEEGIVFVWFGAASGLGENGTPSNADWTVQSNQSGARFGFPVATAGDVNGDGYSDVLVGAHLYDHGETDEGAAFLYFGSATGPGATPDWMGESNQVDARYGQSLATAGDVNGDGYSDIIIGSAYYDNPLLNVGKAYVYYGSETGPNETTDWTVEGALDSATMTYNFGVSTAGDVNDDGYDDIVIGSPGYSNGQTLEGLVSVYLGSAGGLNSIPYWTVEGNSYEARLGYAVNTAGDVNGDEISDLLVSAAWYTNDQFHEGALFLYLGESTNEPPEITTLTCPANPQQVGLDVTATAIFSDPDIGDSHTATWDWGDGSMITTSATVPTVIASHAYTLAGVYTVTATITDAAGETDSATFQYVVVYDSSGGFVSGGGWITSPMGAYIPDPSMAGKATFGFVSKYQKGANIPTGNTEFQFKTANLTFSSTSYDWLVIAGSKAQYKGTGTINGAGNYAFMLTAIDGTPDKFRMKIWDKATGDVIYDNQLGAADTDDPLTVIGGGSIVIHKEK